MGKFKRIQVNDIKAMQKTLDDLPDKNLGKTREEAAEMLNAQILRALDKGYSLKEITELMARGNVSIPAPVIRAKVLSAKATKEKQRQTRPLKKPLRRRRQRPRQPVNTRQPSRHITRRTCQIRSYENEQ